MQVTRKSLHQVLSRYSQCTPRVGVHKYKIQGERIKQLIGYFILRNNLVIHDFFQQSRRLKFFSSSQTMVEPWIKSHLPSQYEKTASYAVNENSLVFGQECTGPMTSAWTGGMARHGLSNPAFNCFIYGQVNLK